MTCRQPADEENRALPNEDRDPAVLLLLDDPRQMAPLQQLLQREGLACDAVASLPDARATFFGAGGHGCLVVAPDVRPGLAQQVATSLHAMDPSLATATFGPPLAGTKVSRAAKLGAFHPGSRAGQGALLRFLRNL